ncbi:hypothetical protein RFI_26349 [Reticulomyxa filosa]|uniref:RNA polymerase II-associated protein 3 n=1 Tax=Reticulomyxa filosa TaxID=46433 RepID=X6MBI0_RETFI|nr:hypothetical protein RFI_26349 [Reticulomyxa filosa]|eukprot:ETO11026.1 hypothetical protein RFI_26349 [Reticulomyxa filosa]
MHPFALQQQIRENATELYDSLADLEKWQKEMTKKDEKLQSQNKKEKIEPNKTIPKETKNKTSESIAKIKKSGNEYYQRKDYKAAIKEYSKGIEIDPKNYVLYCNRGMAQLQCKQFEQAESDCSECIRLISIAKSNKNQERDGNQQEENPEAVEIKAYYRRGVARKNLRHYVSALDDFRQALTLLNNKKKVQRRMKKHKTIVCENKLEMKRIEIAEVWSDHSDDEKVEAAIDSSLKTSHEKKEEPKTIVQLKDQTPSMSVVQEKSQSNDNSPLSAFTYPNTFGEFEKLWSKGKREDKGWKAQVLLQMNTTTKYGIANKENKSAINSKRCKQWHQVFENLLTDEIFSDMIDSIHYIAIQYVNERKQVIEILDRLSKVQRFEMLVMFLDDQRISKLKHIQELFKTSDDVKYSQQILSRYLT